MSKNLRGESDMMRGFLNLSFDDDFFFFDFFLLFSSLFLGKKKTIAHLLSNTKSDTKNRHTSRRLSRTRKEEGLLTAPKRQKNSRHLIVTLIITDSRV